MILQYLSQMKMKNRHYQLLCLANHHLTLQVQQHRPTWENSHTGKATIFVYVGPASMFRLCPPLFLENGPEPSENSLSAKHAVRRGRHSAARPWAVWGRRPREMGPCSVLDSQAGGQHPFF